MFGDILPAYGIYARHVRGMTLSNVHTTHLRPDARPANVFIDVNTQLHAPGPDGIEQAGRSARLLKTSTD
jgi:hypothetical protein